MDSEGIQRLDIIDRDVGQLPEPSGRSDEKLGGLQFNHSVQKHSFAFMSRPQCV